MMGRQVISISPEGVLSGLQRKKGEGIDLRQFGKAEIERASEIKWVPEKQKWAVLCTKGMWKGLYVTLNKECPDGETRVLACNFPCDLYDEYEDAVAAEVETLDFIRVQVGPQALA